MGRSSFDRRKTGSIGGHYGNMFGELGAENCVTDAEINSRGYKDRFGRKFYAIPVISGTENATQPIKKSEGHVEVTNIKTEEPILNYSANIDEVSTIKFMNFDRVV
ncbi:hypothetical protein AB6A40_004117 [Gnathostoma spinigerum]|uniref:Uncharacterized protein n=1 Tax=Gnathostoma spinigerum TaxID=75299 RepID=A0ABD6EBI7_9BILA